jgi:hypothetical protein
MGDIYYRWNCGNPECESINNPIPIDAVKRSIKTGKKIRIFCTICGFSPFSSKVEVKDSSGTAINACDCVKFTGEENRLPTRKIWAGLYKDANGEKHDIEYFKSMGVLPDIYIKWLFHGKPRDKDVSKVT